VSCVEINLSLDFGEKYRTGVGLGDNGRARGRHQAALSVTRRHRSAAWRWLCPGWPAVPPHTWLARPTSRVAGAGSRPENSAQVPKFPLPRISRARVRSLASRVSAPASDKACARARSAPHLIDPHRGPGKPWPDLKRPPTQSGHPDVGRNASTQPAPTAVSRIGRSRSSRRSLLSQPARSDHDRGERQVCFDWNTAVHAARPRVTPPDHPRRGVRGDFRRPSRRDASATPYPGTPPHSRSRAGHAPCSETSVHTRRTPAQSPARGPPPTRPPCWGQSPASSLVLGFVAGPPLVVREPSPSLSHDRAPVVSVRRRRRQYFTIKSLSTEFTTGYLRTRTTARLGRTAATAVSQQPLREQRASRATRPCEADTRS
jgi:hypothetical protein